MQLPELANKTFQKAKINVDASSLVVHENAPREFTSHNLRNMLHTAYARSTDGTKDLYMTVVDTSRSSGTVRHTSEDEESANGLLCHDYYAYTKKDTGSYFHVQLAVQSSPLEINAIHGQIATNSLSMVRPAGYIDNPGIFLEHMAQGEVAVADPSIPEGHFKAADDTALLRLKLFRIMPEAYADKLKQKANEILAEKGNFQILDAHDFTEAITRVSIDAHFVYGLVANVYDSQDFFKSIQRATAYDPENDMPSFQTAGPLRGYRKRERRVQEVEHLKRAWIAGAATCLLNIDRHAPPRRRRISKRDLSERQGIWTQLAATYGDTGGSPTET